MKRGLMIRQYLNIAIIFYMQFFSFLSVRVPLPGLHPISMRSTKQEIQPILATVASNKLSNRIDFLRRMLLFRSRPRKKILILMSDTGGGHRASAQAIEQAIHEQFPRRFKVDVMDIWTLHAKWPYNQFVPNYRYLAKRPLLWRAFYSYGLFPPTKAFTEIMAWRSCFSSFNTVIRSANPDLVVSVHPLCQLMPITIVKQMNKERKPHERIPFVTVVTDLGSAHSTWFDRRVDAVNESNIHNS